MTLNPTWQTSTPGKGTLSIRNVDEGLFVTIQATNTKELDKELYRYINIAGVSCNGQVPVLFNNPNPLFTQQKIPYILIQREFEPALTRKHPGWVEYNEKSGDNFLSRKQAEPFDFNYDIQIVCEQRSDADKILNFLLELLQVQGYITCKDSLNETRTYDSFLESFGDNSEIADLNQRTIGYSLVLRVETELNLTPETSGKWVKTYEVGVHDINDVPV